ncbi:MAG: nitroreductase family protein [Vicinamibacteria bacterium]|nr:nitroreductase family protein [Vicinamibacteria bacterium]
MSVTAQANVPPASAPAVTETAALPAIELPAAEKTGGMPLMDALSKRATSRAFDAKDLPAQQLSNALWAAFGVNRPDGKRTAPSARNWQETDIYVLLKQGAYAYDATAHRLNPVLGDDIRALGATQAFAHEAPVTLVFVADLAKTGDPIAAATAMLAAMDTGFISQNVYLYCASAGLATGVRGMVDRDALGKRLGLRETQRITAAQSIGYPKAAAPE